MTKRILSIIGWIGTALVMIAIAIRFGFPAKDQYGYYMALAGLAWIRATAADPALRNPDEAIALGERAVALTARREVASLDALAAAYAAAGRFSDAVATARAGVELASAAGALELAARFRERLELYQKGQPIRLPGSKFP